MTLKQMYSELAKIAGAHCASGEIFVRSALVSETELRKAQRSILALLDKLNAARTMRDFRMTGTMGDRMRTLEQAERQARQTGERLSHLEQARRTPSPFDVYANEPLRLSSQFRSVYDRIVPMVNPLSGGMPPPEPGARCEAAPFCGDAGCTICPHPTMGVPEEPTRTALEMCDDTACDTCPHPTVE